MDDHSSGQKTNLFNNLMYCHSLAPAKTRLRRWPAVEPMLLTRMLSKAEGLEVAPAVPLKLEEVSLDRAEDLATVDRLVLELAGVDLALGAALVPPTMLLQDSDRLVVVVVQALLDQLVRTKVAVLLAPVEDLDNNNNNNSNSQMFLEERLLRLSTPTSLPSLVSVKE